jgi:hypothetical protein
MRKPLMSIFAGLLLFVNYTFSQDFDVPKEYQFTAKEDYSRYEKDIIAGAKWLVTTPLNEQQDKRKEVSMFVVKWINGSPTVNVEINPTIMDFEEKNRGMLTIYMASSAKYVLENNYSTDMRAKHKAALRHMISVYNSGKGIQKDRKMEKLIKSDEGGKLDEWLADNLKINN